MLADLESASPRQLMRMQKTQHHEAYLRRASTLLHACHAAGVWAKVNVLFFPGETGETILQTEDWLEKHRSVIKGLSVGPTILFRYGSASQKTLADFAAQGASVVDHRALDRDGYAQLHLSRELSHAETLEHAARISRSFMTERDYFDLKSFSYFPRSLSWREFLRMIQSKPDANYSFRLEPPLKKTDVEGVAL